MNNIIIAFFIGHVVFFGLYLFFSLLNYKNITKMNYNFRNHFPYEFNFEDDFRINLPGKIALLASLTCSIIFYIFFKNNYNNGYYVFVMIMGIINVISIGAIAFIDLRSTRAHLLMVVINVVSSFIIPSSIAINASIEYTTYKSVSGLVIAIISVIFCFIIFILMMNPKLTKWAKLDEIKAPDGAISYIRPKYFVLAYTEWILIFYSLLVELLVYISAILI